MADCYTELILKNVNQDEFKKWFDKKVDEFVYYSPAQDGGFGAEIEGGYGYYFWEALSFMMIDKFEGIVFKGSNQVDFGDHLVRTTFECDGKEIVLERTLEFPDSYDEEDDEFFEEECDEETDGWREILAIENDIPYSVRFSVAEVIACAKAYTELNKKLKDSALVKSVCDKYNISTEKLKQYSTILNFKKR